MVDYIIICNYFLPWKRFYIAPHTDLGFVTWWASANEMWAHIAYVLRSRCSKESNLKFLLTFLLFFLCIQNDKSLIGTIRLAWRRTVSWPTGGYIKYEREINLWCFLSHWDMGFFFLLPFYLPFSSSHSFSSLLSPLFFPPLPCTPLLLHCPPPPPFVNETLIQQNQETVYVIWNFWKIIYFRYIHK